MQAHAAAACCEQLRVQRLLWQTNELRLLNQAGRVVMEMWKPFLSQVRLGSGRQEGVGIHIAGLHKNTPWKVGFQNSIYTGCAEQRGAR